MLSSLRCRPPAVEPPPVSAIRAGDGALAVATGTSGTAHGTPAGEGAWRADQSHLPPPTGRTVRPRRPRVTADRVRGPQPRAHPADVLPWRRAGHRDHPAAYL